MVVLATFLASLNSQPRQDDENSTQNGVNTSDEEFERQLEEAAVIEEQERRSKKPKMKKVKVPLAGNKKKSTRLNKLDDADGYEVGVPLSKSPSI